MQSNFFASVLERHYAIFQECLEGISSKHVFSHNSKIRRREARDREVLLLFLFLLWCFFLLIFTEKGKSSALRHCVGVQVECLTTEA